MSLSTRENNVQARETMLLTREATIAEREARILERENRLIAKEKWAADLHEREKLIHEREKIVHDREQRLERLVREQEDTMDVDSFKDKQGNLIPLSITVRTNRSTPIFSSISSTTTSPRK